MARIQFLSLRAAAPTVRENPFNNCQQAPAEHAQTGMFFQGARP